jgi:flagellar L-ring protein precursor FlgH
LFGDLAGDVRAGQVNDLVTILVYERASAVAKGATNTARKSDAKYSVSALAGPVPVTGALANMAGASGESQLQGQGSTSRETTLTTTLSARVTHVLPNGYLVVEGVRDLLVNSERQAITVRGVIRPLDLGPGNTVRSDRVAQLEVKVSGKGVVEDSIRRPMFLYRLLMGILPF